MDIFSLKCLFSSLLFFSLGEAPEGFRLRMVHIFLRHGDRTAHHEIPGYTPEPVQCFVDQTLLNSVRKLKAFVPTMEKFAGKQPQGSYFQNWALLPNKTQCGGSSLTGIGAVQHLKLGQHFHEKYVTQNALFSKKVALTSQIYTRSTISSRTYQSAIAFLYGFLPFRVFNLTNLNIDNNSDTSFCSPLLSRQKTCYCSYGNILHQQVHNMRRYFVRTSEKERQVLNSVTKTFGFSPEKVSSFSLPMDIFSLAACHNMSNPCSAYDDRSCLNVPQYRQVWNSLDEEGKFLIHESRKTYSEFSNIVLHPLFIELARRMKEEVEKRQPYKVVIYSGHDITLTPLLVVLGLDDGKWVRYASRVVIEFYEAMSKKDKQKYYLKFLFNGEDLTEKVRFCEGRTFHGLCSFRLFYDFVFTEMLQQFRYTSYYDACSRK